MPSDRGRHAALYLNNQHVGEVLVKGGDTSWGFGDFTPGPGFSAFAPLYGQWAMLMHEDVDGSRIYPVSEAAAEELRNVEREVDQIRARLYFHEKDEWCDVVQLNIDGVLLEWKEY